MRAVRAVSILFAVVVTILCAALDEPTRGGAAWVFVGIALAAALALVLWPRGRRAQGAGPACGLDLLRAGLVLGFTGFGGGLAVLTQVEHRLVGRERWITPEGFLESTALGQSLPGAISTNTLGFVGWRLARLRGALALVGGFVLPSFLLMVVFSLLYARLRQFAVVAGVFHLLNPAVAGMVGAMAVRLAAELVRAPGRAGRPARSAAGSRRAAGRAGGGGRGRRAGPGRPRGRARGRAARRGAPPGAELARDGDAASLGARVARAGPAQGPARLAAGEIHRLGELATVFLRAGALTFGGGYVIVPVLEAELVQGRHWLTAQAFVDAMALGQITPGPVLITSTFVGYTLAGLAGALVSTLAVFLPSLVLVVLVSLSSTGSATRPGSRPSCSACNPRSWD